LAHPRKKRRLALQECLKAGIKKLIKDWSLICSVCNRGIKNCYTG